MHDLVTLGRKEINWVANIDNYDWILNDESKEERGWKTLSRSTTGKDPMYW